MTCPSTYARPATECALFEHACRNQLPLLLKGPTGCGKTRFVAHMAARLGRRSHTVSCHDDLTAADLTGRYLLKGGDTVWSTGRSPAPFAKAAICYLDEIVEARKDVTVVLHPLTDDRRILPLERTGEVLEAPPEFMLVVSYNPGYQNAPQGAEAVDAAALRCDRIRFLPRRIRRSEIVSRRADFRRARCVPLVRAGGRLRALKGQDLEEGVSTRLFVYCATLIRDGVSQTSRSRPRSSSR